MSFSPNEIAGEIKNSFLNLNQLQTDYRQKIADSWPQSIDDSKARSDWGWKPEYDLSKMTRDMFENL
jgi:nucleoside-diphosphate-sugar epimerase